MLKGAVKYIIKMCRKIRLKEGCLKTSMGFLSVYYIAVRCTFNWSDNQCSTNIMVLCTLAITKNLHSI